MEEITPYDIGLDVTIKLTEAGYPPVRWDVHPPTDEDKRLMLTIMWGSGAAVRYVLDTAMTTAELSEAILAGELETEFVRRPTGPSKRFITRLSRRSGKGSRSRYTRSKKQRKKRTR